MRSSRFYFTVNCTRFLLVADPQILGETFDSNGYNSFAIYDNDRTLKTSFELAMANSQPDVICFLGDLMDEGSVANTAQYERYLQRFKRIFAVPKNVKVLESFV